MKVRYVHLSRPSSQSPFDDETFNRFKLESLTARNEKVSFLFARQSDRLDDSLQTANLLSWQHIDNSVLGTRSFLSMSYPSLVSWNSLSVCPSLSPLTLGVILSWWFISQIYAGNYRLRPFAVFDVISMAVTDVDFYGLMEWCLLSIPRLMCWQAAIVQRRFWMSCQLLSVGPPLQGKPWWWLSPRKSILPRLQRWSGTGLRRRQRLSHLWWKNAILWQA